LCERRAQDGGVISQTFRQLLVTGAWNPGVDKRRPVSS
jgi:hypothetical protein